MKQFKANSKKVLDLMINSIYTNKEIFLRELISNASDASDKLYYKSLKENLGLTRSDFKIIIEKDDAARALTIIDNGVGMNAHDLEHNLGMISNSDSEIFKKLEDASDDINIIGQFGVGFYSAFMVAKRIEVETKKYNETTASLWISEGLDGYQIKASNKNETGTIIRLFLKDDTEEENYSTFLDEDTIRSLIKKYSDFIRYPIMMEVTTTTTVKNKETTKQEVVTLNSMMPLWQKHKSEISKEALDAFYENTLGHHEAPLYSQVI
ncbi:MAG: ATP-binding protein, partial [Erysipelotrichaceae bacterium]|nr:ATP-binding protein [Erysipelotrichaceae bacterium]